jgi:hypothetical protein
MKWPSNEGKPGQQAASDEVRVLGQGFKIEGRESAKDARQEVSKVPSPHPHRQEGSQEGRQEVHDHLRSVFQG